MTHICVKEHVNIGSDNDLSPDRCQAIVWINAPILSIRPKGTYFYEILFEIQKFSFMEIHLNIDWLILYLRIPEKHGLSSWSPKMSSGKWRPFCLSLNVLKASVFVSTKAEYEEEAISWEAVQFADNRQCLDLLEGAPGVFSVINEVTNGRTSCRNKKK